MNVLTGKTPTGAGPQNLHQRTLTTSGVHTVEIKKRSIDTVEYAKKRQKIENPEGLLARALNTFDAEGLKTAVEDGADINKKTKGARDFPIFLGIFKGGKSDLFQQIMTFNPDLTVSSKYFLKKTPLEFAIGRADPDATRMLLQHGALLTPDLQRGAFYDMRASQFDPGRFNAQLKTDTLKLLRQAQDSQKMMMLATSTSDDSID